MNLQHRNRIFDKLSAEQFEDRSDPELSELYNQIEDHFYKAVDLRQRGERQEGNYELEIANRLLEAAESVKTYDKF